MSLGIWLAKWRRAGQPDYEGSAGVPQIDE